MKVAFPMKNETELAADFVHSKYIGIYDGNADKMNFMPMSEMTKNVGAAMFFDAMMAQGLTSVVSPNFSFMAFRVFRDYNIATYKASGWSVEENIQNLKANTLQPFHSLETDVKSCSSSCSSCSSTCSGN
jgi:predicted Fe-Mo cluster-binding NifX family protein